MKIHDLTPGQIIVADGGFDCMAPGPKAVRADPTRDGEAALYVDCGCGMHFLDGQVDDEGGDVVGFKAEAR